MIEPPTRWTGKSLAAAVCILLLAALGLFSMRQQKAAGSRTPEKPHSLRTP